IAWSTPGVVDVVDRTVVAATSSRPAPIIQTDVVGEIDRDARISDTSRIVVSVEGSAVQLEGSVDTDPERLAAEEDAWFVSGVRSVINHLWSNAGPRATRNRGS